MGSRSWWDIRINLWKTAAWGILVTGVINWGWPRVSLWTVQEAEVALYGLVSLLVSLQAGWFLSWMLYAWNDPDEVEKNKSPDKFMAPRLSFTALLPVRHEEMVIKDTIRAISAINYPEEKKELLVLVRPDDGATITAAGIAIKAEGKENIRMVLVDDEPVNKPNQLNWGLKEADRDVVVVFDAEDQPHRDIYHIANTVMVEAKADVVQSGVQLMNFNSRWFSALNCLEYFFWFKSALHFFAKNGVIPLGGNTVFFKRTWLKLVGGWDETCLTEDGDIGIRLSLQGARIKVVYDERYATQEETPDSIGAFVRQRTRWNQGFLQIFLKGEWLRFPGWKQRLLAGYLLILPEILAGMLFLTPALTAVAISAHLPLPAVLLSFVPLGLLALQVVVLVVGLWVFAASYQRGYPAKATLWVIVGFVPYVAVLAIGAMRGLVRLVAHDLAWEKTLHINAHRQKVYAVA